MTSPAEIEFSRPISPEGIGEKGKTMSIQADRGECDRLAERLGLNRLESLSAEIDLAPQKKGRIIHLKGSFQADIQQTCVVTLEPIETRIEASIERLYDTTLLTLGDGEKINDDKDIGADIDAENDDPPEPLMEGQIDIGEAISEQLALEINPFPRKPGISFVDFSSETEDGNGAGIVKAVSSAGPFSGLATLKKKLTK
ncbi:MAG TPA: DUF177 domain-containing protein [Rhodospirillales bacterium]|jgi:hypothetical protein|nr:DUF177 domain-containing protein [Rhodospirillales bacterium]HIM77800.1 DUF177 domain-containing protein [Rhodospirillales bacterium]